MGGRLRCYACSSLVVRVGRGVWKFYCVILQTEWANGLFGCIFSLESEFRLNAEEIIF